MDHVSPRHCVGADGTLNYFEALNLSRGAVDMLAVTTLSDKLAHFEHSLNRKNVFIKWQMLANKSRQVKQEVAWCTPGLTIKTILLFE